MRFLSTLIWFFASGLFGNELSLVLVTDNRDGVCVCVWFWASVCLYRERIRRIVEVGFCKLFFFWIVGFSPVFCSAYSIALGLPVLKRVLFSSER